MIGLNPRYDIIDMLIIKHNVRDGEYDLETMEYKRVKQLYG